MMLKRRATPARRPATPTFVETAGARAFGVFRARQATLAETFGISIRTIGE